MSRSPAGLSGLGATVRYGGALWLVVGRSFGNPGECPVLYDLCGDDGEPRRVRADLCLEVRAAPAKSPAAPRSAGAPLPLAVHPAASSHADRSRLPENCVALPGLVERARRVALKRWWHSPIGHRATPGLVEVGNVYVDGQPMDMSFAGRSAGRSDAGLMEAARACAVRIDQPQVLIDAGTGRPCDTEEDGSPPPPRAA